MTAATTTSVGNLRAQSAPAVRLSQLRTPLRQLSAGPDGSATLARMEPSGELIELCHATVAHTDPVRWEQIETAAQVYGLLEHEGLRRLLAREVAADGTPVLIFEQAPERDLGGLLLGGPMPEHDVWALARRIALALATMHRFGLAHHRLSLSAVRLRDDGTPLLDFAWLDLGAARHALDAACAPPELGREPLDLSSDLYAYGALLRVLLLGRAPKPHEPMPRGPFEPLLKQLLLSVREARPSIAEVCVALEAMTGLSVRALELSATRQSMPANLNVQSTVRPRERHTETTQLREGMRLGRFELVRKIGQGGMGEVFEAIDRASGQRAALKVLRTDSTPNPAHLARFRKEARILSQLRSPYIANLIEWNQDAGVHYIALEFVEGGDLGQWLEQRGGRLHEHEALAIVAEVCRGLSDAHALGIVHRDIKPQNIMLESTDEPAPRLKLCDFGIARALDKKSGTIAFTEHDKLIGTPDYMAPEQATGSELTPATDVYALGVMLFLLVSGRLPFDIEDTVAILVAHTAKPAPKLAEVCPDVSEATAALVERMLAKRPGDRFADADLLLEAIEGILHGAPSTAAVHPARPAAPPNKLARHQFEYHLEASPEALWPYVSNTDRLNRAVGLPPVAFRRVIGALGVETYASNRVMGVSLRWRVQPFEWVEGQRWGVLRVFDGGVMHWFTVELELLPKPGGGTLLRYTMVLEPRHLLGEWIVALEMRWKQRPALARVFARIDAHAQKLVPAAESSDAFQAAPPLTAAQRAALTRGIEQLAQDGVAPALLDALAKFCEQASDQQITALRPLEFARERGLDSDALVDACLRGAYHGLLVLLWEVLCPLCRVPSDFAESLRALADHGHCPSCNTDFALDFTQSLELVFRVSRDVRVSELRTYCVSGPAFAPHVAAQMRLAPGERMRLSLSLSAGTYKIRSPQLPYSYALQISPSGSVKRSRVRFTTESLHEPRRVLLAPGSQLLELENDLARELVVRVERAAPREDALTAARAACLPSFRKLFPGEVLASGRLVAVGRTAFLIAAVQGARQLMQDLGDARAFEIMLKLIEKIEDAVAAEGGAMVKTANGAVLCAFDSAASAARAAVTLRDRLNLECELDVHIVVHQGPAVAATVDGRLDYFGQTVESALDLCPFASSSEVLLSTEVAEDPHVIADLTGRGHTLELIELDALNQSAVRVSPATGFERSA